MVLRQFVAFTIPSRSADLSSAGHTPIDISFTTPAGRRLASTVGAMLSPPPAGETLEAYPNLSDA